MKIPALTKLHKEKGTEWVEEKVHWQEWVEEKRLK
jgi:hypothetical protein